MYIYWHLSVYLPICLSILLSIYIYIHLFVCRSIYLSIYLFFQSIYPYLVSVCDECTPVCMHIYNIPACMYVCICLYIYVATSPCIYVYIYIYLYISLSMYDYAFIYISICQCLSPSVTLFTLTCLHRHPKCVHICLWHCVYSNTRELIKTN